MKTNKVLSFSIKDIIHILLAIIVLSILLSGIMLKKFNSNKLIYIQNDFNQIQEFLNNSTSSEWGVLYGKETEDVLLLTNSKFKEFSKNNKVFDINGIVSFRDIEDLDEIILFLNPFLENQKLNLKLINDGFYVSVSRKGKDYSEIFFINQNIDDVNFEKIHLTLYHKLIEH